MGFFSKKKTYVGISNTPLLDKNKKPIADKDGVASYINESAKTNGQVEGTMFDYMTMAREQSIVRGVKNLDRWASKEGNYSYAGELKGTLDSLSNKEKLNIIKQSIIDKNNKEITFLYTDNFSYDYGHLVKQILINKYDFNPTTNILIVNDRESYLENAEIHFNEPILLNELNNPGFNAGSTPYRNMDLNRTYTESNIVIDENYQFNFFEATLINNFTYITEESLTEVEVITTTPSEDPNEEPTVTSDKTSTSNGTTIIDNTNIEDLIEKVYINQTEELVTLSEEEVEDVENSTVTITREKLYTITENFKCTYLLIDNFDSYFFSQNIDWDSLTEAEWVDLVDSIDDTEIAVQLAYTYIENGITNIVYETIKEEDVNYSGDVLYDIPFKNFIPNVYFKDKFTYSDKKSSGRSGSGSGLFNISFEYLDSIGASDKGKTSEFYKQSKKAASKLNLDYQDLLDELREGIEDEKGIYNSYITFGIPLNSQVQLEISYLFKFFEQYFKYCDIDNLYPDNFIFEKDTEYSLNNKPIKIKDNVAKGVIDTNNISFKVVTGNIGEIGSYENSVSNFSLKEQYLTHYLRKQITEDTYLEYTLIDTISKKYVNNKKWAYSGGEGSELLIPIDLALIKDYNFRDKENLLYSAMYIELQTYVVKKVKFYETGFFKILVFAASVLLAPVTGGTSLSLNAIITAAVINLAIGVAIDIVVKVLVKVLGVDIVKILAVAIIIIGIIKGNTNALKSLEKGSKAFTVLVMRADLLIKYGIKIVNTVNTIEQQQLRDSYLKEKDAYEKKMQELEDYNDKYGKYRPNENLTYLDEDIRYSSPIVDDTVDAMIQRSLNSNPALVTINYVHGYVDYILALPTVSETAYKPIKED